MIKRFKTLAVALLTALFIGGGSLAVAAGHQANVDPDRLGDIHVVKYDDSQGLSKPDGTQKTDITANPIEGIEFTLSRVMLDDAGKAIDLTTNDGVKAAAALDAAKIAANKTAYGVQQKDVKKTGAAGDADFTDLPVGVYLLEETNSTAADGTVYKGASPSLVFLPTTNPVDQSSWITEGDKYAVWVYPKNSVESNVKTVVDADKHVGEKIDYTVTASVPAVTIDAQGKHNLTDFNFYDQLDMKLDLADASDVQVLVNGTPLDQGTDYQVKIYPASDDKGQFLYVYVDDPGLAKIAKAKDANAGTEVVLKFSPKVTASGVVPNQATVFKNAGEGAGKTTPPEDTPPTPPEGSEKTNVVVSAWGKVNVKKTDENGKPLKGAEFQIFKSTDTNFTTPLEVNGQKTFVSDDQGVVTIDGLHVTDAADDAMLGETFSYKLVETKAPDGYELRHEPFDIMLTINSIEKVKYTIGDDGMITDVARELSEISQAPDAADGSLGTTLVAHTDVVNIETKPKLPLTGGAGVALFGIVGLAVVAGGLYYSRRTAKA